MGYGAFRVPYGRSVGSSETRGRAEPMPGARSLRSLGVLLTMSKFTEHQNRQGHSDHDGSRQVQASRHMAEHRQNTNIVHIVKKTKRSSPTFNLFLFFPPSR